MNGEYIKQLANKLSVIYELLILEYYDYKQSEFIKEVNYD